MKKIISAFLFLLFATAAFSQTDSSKLHKRFPVGFFHRANTTINGISYGLWTFGAEPRHTITNGLRLELVGEGFLTPMIPESGIPDNDTAYAELMHAPQSEKIRGINLSGTGSACECMVSGISVGPFGQVITKVNGISAAGFVNIIQQTNGIQLALLGNNAYQMKGIQAAFVGNYSEKMYGIQIGLINESKHTRGIQIGLWNKNEKRKWPIINWNFKS